VIALAIMVQRRDVFCQDNHRIVDMEVITSSNERATSDSIGGKTTFATFSSFTKMF
jgi:hypothetical protein